jgi:2-polyprenyl-6-methoxyphenol hydroxylase-like FAD-dependent oxidoreductase
MLRHAAMAERLRGSGDLPTFFRRSAGSGWALVGDAGHHKDPLVARGIADAFRDAELLSASASAGWDHDLDEALRKYEAARDAAAGPVAAANAALAQLDAPVADLARSWQRLAALEERLDPVGEGLR